MLVCLIIFPTSVLHFVFLSFFSPPISYNLDGMQFMLFFLCFFGGQCVGIFVGGSL